MLDRLPTERSSPQVPRQTGPAFPSALCKTPRDTPEELVAYQQFARRYIFQTSCSRVSRSVRAAQKPLVRSCTCASSPRHEASLAASRPGTAGPPPPRSLSPWYPATYGETTHRANLRSSARCLRLGTSPFLFRAVPRPATDSTRGLPRPRDARPSRLQPTHSRLSEEVSGLPPTNSFPLVLARDRSRASSPPSLPN